MDLSGDQNAAEEYFPKSWPLLRLAMIAAVYLVYVVEGHVPSATPAIMLLIAVTGVLPVGVIWRIVSGYDDPARAIGLVLVVVVPFFLFGMGMALWAAEGGIEWSAAIAAKLAVVSTAVLYLRRQPMAIFSAQLAIWAPISVFFFSMTSVLSLLFGLLVALLVTREQLERDKNEISLQEAQERISKRAQEILSDYEKTGQGWFWETDRRMLLTYVSEAVAEALGARAVSLIGQPLTTMFDLGDSGQESERTLAFHLSARSSFSELPVRADIKGEERWWSISGRPIFSKSGSFLGFRGSGTDLTERRRSQERATRLAAYDSLTGLANRHQMTQALEKVLSAKQKSHRHCAVFMMDLDRFKQVNDTMGHPAGDKLLKEVAQRLERVIGKEGQVGRLGGDEFLVILPNRVLREPLGELAKSIIHSLSQPYAIDGKRVTIGASVGIALSPDDGLTTEEMLRTADLALYAAKGAGRGCFHFYSEDLHAQAEARSQLEEDLRDAISNGQLELYYQPAVSTATEKITGFEALMRWQHPVKGWISPEDFIAAGEDTGLIQQMGEWALRQACDDLAKWPREVSVAVNVSPLQFANPQLPKIVASALASSGVNPSRLELEITESVFLSDDYGTDAMFTALKKLGVRLALDDFGTGYSSLGYLKRAPLDKIKIDQSFVRGATVEGSHNGAIIASITSLAEALGMDTTAEGVETQDELEMVRMHGCSHVQGFIYEKPMSGEAALQRMQYGLAAVARGPRRSRPLRQSMLRRFVLHHKGVRYDGTIRNISSTGAQIEGPWDVVVGTDLRLELSSGSFVTGTVRWSAGNRIGVEFAEPLERTNSGKIAVLQAPPPAPIVHELAQKAG
ncbi:EAL domain-containing protein [Aurantiacibacter hainanensis]|uniref:EAL domain-containing protein n=1 Tax=Aurantiacibacter hainanensis TaxID=3076114 RepID=UPI0030C6CF46